MAAEQKQALAVFDDGVMFVIDEERLTEPIALSARSIKIYKAQEKPGAPEWPKTRKELFERAKHGWQNACFADCMANWESLDDDLGGTEYFTIYNCGGAREEEASVRRRPLCGPGMR